MSKQSELIEGIVTFVEARLDASYVDPKYEAVIRDIFRCTSNKAIGRFVLSCLLAKLDNVEYDIRKPYTKIEADDSYSGRGYDEQFIQPAIDIYKLPCNSTTAYLTPAFRNLDRVIERGFIFVGRPKDIYDKAVDLINDVHDGELDAEDAIKESFRQLFVLKAENELRMAQLLESLKRNGDALELSSEEILTIVTQHLASRNASRLPVLAVAAAYAAVDDLILEVASPLNAHNAADSQTGSFGDVEVTAVNDDQVFTCYEMKDKPVTQHDLEVAMAKVAAHRETIDNYIIITTFPTDEDVHRFAKDLYEKTGIEFAILDCLGFIRHFLHFFHRRRVQFLDKYQELVLAEPESAVSQALKEAFLVLRKTFESDR